MLLPFVAEGAGACESYLTSKIPNKYIKDVFLMIYLSTLFLFFLFLVLQKSESEIYKGCNPVIL